MASTTHQKPSGITKAQTSPQYAGEGLKRSRRRRAAVTIILWLLIIALFYTGALYLKRFVFAQYGGFTSFLSGIFGDNKGGGLKAGQPKVTKTVSNGKPAHNITFYGPDYAKVTIPSLGKSATISNGSATITVEDWQLIPELPAEGTETITVSLKAEMRDGVASGEIAVPEYEIEIPETPLELLSPNPAAHSGSAGTIEVRINTKRGAKVLIGGNDVSSLVAQDGSLSYNVHISLPSEQSVIVTSQLPRHRPSRIEIKVSSPSGPVELSLNPVFPAETESETVTITGRAPVRATLETDAELASEIEVNGETGTFRMTVKLKYGENVIQVTASLEGVGSGTRSVAVTRVPNVQEYTKRAQKMDYARLKNNTANLIGAIFLLEGEITDIISDLSGKIYLMDVGGRNMVAFRYEGKGTLAQGGKYRVYADVSGRYVDLPLLTGRFAYKN